VALYVLAELVVIISVGNVLLVASMSISEKIKFVYEGTNLR
jgi:hypothetical protein